MHLTRPKFDHEELALLQECLDSGWVTQGPMTSRFESLFAARHQVPHALTTTSCTAALHLAMLALGIGPQDEVIVPAFTWVTSAHCAEYVGARAIFADVTPGTFNLDPEACAAAVTPRTRAVVVVHLFGLAAEMDRILAVADRYGLRVVEDAACAVGTTYDGRPVGGLATAGCFSFHPRKVISTGEGGMVTTRDGDIAARVRSLRNHGATGLAAADAASPKPYSMSTFDRLGFNLRLSDIQSAVGIAQMAKLDALLEERRRLAGRYLHLLRDVEELALPGAPAKCGHTYQSFVIRVLRGGREHRNRIMEHLEARGITTRPGTHAVHRLGYYVAKYGLRAGDFPVAAASEDTSITLPLFPEMREADLALVVGELKGALCRK